MSFQPRMLENGRICCSRPDALCDTCKAALRTAQSFDPPDPYAAGIAKLRAAMHLPPTQTTPEPLTDYAAPDPYRADLEKLSRSEQR